MADDLAVRVARVHGRLKYLHALARNLRAPQPPNHLFSFAGKHRAADRFNPARIRDHYFQTVTRSRASCSLGSPSGPALAGYRIPLESPWRSGRARKQGAREIEPGIVPAQISPPA